jgi:hypothetical protein
MHRTLYRTGGARQSQPVDPNQLFLPKVGYQDRAPAGCPGAAGAWTSELEKL